MAHHTKNQTVPGCPKCGRPVKDADKVTDSPNATHLARYAEHNSRLQTWIGAYGAGLASLLVYQFRTAVNDTQALYQAKGATAAALSGPSLNSVLATMHQHLSYALRLVAVALAIQVGLLALNKYTQLAAAHANKDHAKCSYWDRLSDWCCDQDWIDMLCDLASIGFLALATVYGLQALGIQP